MFYESPPAELVEEYEPGAKNQRMTSLRHDDPELERARNELSLRNASLRGATALESMIQLSFLDLPSGEQPAA